MEQRRWACLETTQRQRRRAAQQDGTDALMRDLLALQRSRSLRDPSTHRSVDSSSKVAAEPEADLPDHSRRGALKTLLNQLAENPQPKPSHRPRRRFKRSAGRHAAPAAGAGALDRPAARAAVSINSNSQEVVCGNKYLFGAGGEELQQPQVSQDSRIVCGGIPWNWSHIHHRGKSFLDMAGRSLSCGLSDPKSASAITSLL